MRTKKQKEIDKKNAYITKSYFAKYRKKVEEAKQSLGSFMSDTKWRKLFEAIEQSDVSITDSRMCDPVNEEIYPIELTLEESNPKYTIDRSACPVCLDEIKYILITCKTESDLEKLVKDIDAVGKYEYEFENLTTLKIWGYR